MELIQEYKKIMDKAFSKHFPDWEEMSPLDPIKVFAEGVGCSLSEIEKRQNRYVDTVLDSLPALFSFYPKKAVQPSGLFAFTPSTKMNEPQRLSSESSFRFQAEEQVCHVSPIQPTEIFPVVGFSSRTDECTTVLHFSAMSPMSEMAIHFVPENDGEEAVSQLKNMSLKVKGANPQNLAWEDLVISNETENFTKYGVIRISPSGEKGQVFSSGSCEFELQLFYEEGVPRGEYYMNVVPCYLSQVEEYFELGQLQGEPWEEIPLDNKALAPPAELLLHFADDHSVRIQRIDTDLLKLKHSDNDRFSNGFFYNGTNHSLIIPCAHNLLQNYNGGVSVLVPHLTRVPPFDWLSKAFQGNAGEYSNIIEQIEAIAPLSAYVPREDKLDFLKRFYASVRTFAGHNSPQHGLISHELRSHILCCDESIQSAEVEIDSRNRCVTVFVLTQNPSDDRSLVLSDEVRKSVAEFLTRYIPLDYEWKIEPFRKVELQFHITVQVLLDEMRMGILTDELLQEKVVQKLRKLLLPPPFGNIGAGEAYTKQSIFKQLEWKLMGSQGDNSHLRRTEVMKLHGLIIHGATSKYVDTIRRSAGEIFFPTVEVDSRIEAGDSYLDGVRGESYAIGQVISTGESSHA